MVLTCIHFSDWGRLRQQHPTCRLTPSVVHGVSDRSIVNRNQDFAVKHGHDINLEAEVHRIPRALAHTLKKPRNLT